MRRLALTLALCLPSAALACPGDLLLSCPIGKKRLELCLDDATLTYSFGPAGRPELVLPTPIRDAAYQPWSGVGRAMWDAVSFQNKDITYEVWTSFDRLDETAVWEGGVNVLRGDALQASLTCAKGSVAGDLYPVMEAKLAAGQCWNRDAHHWQDQPCP